MRHNGMRLVVSTQSPSALAPELLLTVAVLHRFHSHDWLLAFLERKLPRSPGTGTPRGRNSSPCAPGRRSLFSSHPPRSAGTAAAAAAAASTAA